MTKAICVYVRNIPAIFSNNGPVWIYTGFKSHTQITFLYKVRYLFKIQIKNLWEKVYFSFTSKLW